MKLAGEVAKRPWGAGKKGCDHRVEELNTLAEVEGLEDASWGRGDVNSASAGEKQWLCGLPSPSFLIASTSNSGDLRRQGRRVFIYLSVYFFYLPADRIKEEMWKPIEKEQSVNPKCFPAKCLSMGCTYRETTKQKSCLEPVGAEGLKCQWLNLRKVNWRLQSGAFSDLLRAGTVSVTSC